MAEAETKSVISVDPLFNRDVAKMNSWLFKLLL